MQKICHIAIIGSGTMGRTIALAFAWKGYEVSLYDNNAQQLASAIKEIRAKVDVLRAEGFLSQSQIHEVNGRIHFSDVLHDAVQQASFIVEAILEDVAAKQKLYAGLEAICSTDAIIASNTSGLDPDVVAAAMQHPQRFIITHFWTPAHLMPLVEVLGCNATSNATIDITMSLLLAIGKQPILLKKYLPGFIGNRLQFALLREAQYLFENDYASKEAIDVAVTAGIARRLVQTGPLMSADMGGLDVYQIIASYLFASLSNEKEPFASHRNLTGEGNVGLKSGKGYYDWSGESGHEMQQQREKQLLEFLKQNNQC